VLLRVIGDGSPGPHTPSDVFLQQTGATRLASTGDTGRGVTAAVLDTGIDNLPDFSGRLIGGVDLSGTRTTRSRTVTGMARSWPA
jgi:subtilisin family serine protease